MKEDANVLKEDVSVLKEDASVLKQDVKIVKNCIVSIDEKLNEYEIILKRVKQ